VCQPPAVTLLDWQTIRQMEIEYFRLIQRLEQNLIFTVNLIVSMILVLVATIT